jgi:Holliday junction resolvasome RuvABC endonuclease subunit
MLVLGLDAGVVCGYSLIDVLSRSQLNVLDYGEIPVPSNVTLMVAVQDWLEARRELHKQGFSVAVEDLLTIGAGSRYCPKEAKEVRGVIRLFVERYGIPHKFYHPSSVKSALGGVRKKTEERASVAKILGMNLKGYSLHATDALGVALVYAQRELGWVPQTAPLMGSAPKVKRRSKAEKFEDVDLSDPANKDLLLEAMEAGAVRFPGGGRGRR